MAHGGRRSRTYVERGGQAASTPSRPAPGTAVSRHADGVELVDDDGQRHAADEVVVATHADQALRLLADPTDDERAVLGAFGYSRNETCCTPTRRAAGARRRPRVVELPDGRLRADADRTRVSPTG